MTDEQAREAEKRHGHPAKYWAYYDGRNSVVFKSRCEFEASHLRAEWEAGRRHILSEMRLDLDEEWDED